MNSTDQQIQSVVDESQSYHVLYLDSSAIDELSEALASFKCRGDLDGDEVKPSNFPLPSVGPQLAGCLNELLHGKGIVVVRGLDPDRYNPEDNVTLFLTISGFLGKDRGVQSVVAGCGNMITHVTHYKWSVPNGDRYAIYTTQALPFHTDMGTEILALQVRGCAFEGGDTMTASIDTICEAMQASGEEGRSALQLLMRQDWPVRLTIRKYQLSPLIARHDGRLVVAVDIGRLGACRGNLAPELSAEQLWAYNILQTTAREHHVRLQHVRGDLVFINNLRHLHARDAYVDDMGQTRHLLHLWLRTSFGPWPVPESMSVPFETAFSPKLITKKNSSYQIDPLPLFRIGSRYSSGTAAFVPADSDINADGSDD